MRVLLLHDVPGVGKAGEIANVADGYGRNYLVPRKLAMLASAGVSRNLELQQKSIQRRAERERADAESVAARVQAEPITIEANTGVGGKLYGSITSQDIAAALQEKHGLEIDRRKIELAEPIKLVGTYTVPIRFMRDVVAQVTLNVTGPGGVVPAEEAAAAPAAEAEAETEAPAAEEPAPAA
ncbi:MAG: 50S ribosomal protein L9 [Armatimonadetes bacterium]|nr:50S ribosomal protein L9 [Armatimonadota bacterium]